MRLTWLDVIASGYDAGVKLSHALRPRQGLSSQDRALEQDRAAGGRSRREVKLDDGGVARASVALLQHERGRRVYAYLRFSVKGRTVTRYIGPVTASSREDALRQGWRAARAAGLLRLRNR